jgi:hypothetical protein
MGFFTPRSGKIFGDVNRDNSGGWLGGKHVPPKARNPRPKGAQKEGGAYRDHSGKIIATGKGKKGWI